MIPLADAESATSGAKAAALGALLRRGFPVPDGFVLPFGTTPESLPTAIGRGLARLGDCWLAVRSSASGEDADGASAAGQYDSVLGVRGPAGVAQAVRTCWSSWHSERAIAYRADDSREAEAGMAVLVQRLVDADASGVLFTPAEPDDETRIEAAWGLGIGVVGGTVTPDAVRVRGRTVVTTVGEKRVRVDREGDRLTSREVMEEHRRRRVLDDVLAVRLAELGRELSAVLGGPLDVEWAVQNDEVWILQARPVTAPLPRSIPGELSPTSLVGTPASPGTATGRGRVVAGPADFGAVQPGDILVCPSTDPAWTPLLRLAGGVVTEVGGALSHAAIVARELRIPAVVGVRDATSAIRTGSLWTIDGNAGTATPHSHPQDGDPACPRDTSI